MSIELARFYATRNTNGFLTHQSFAAGTYILQGMQTQMLLLSGTYFDIGVYVNGSAVPTIDRTFVSTGGGSPALSDSSYRFDIFPDIILPLAATFNIQTFTQGVAGNMQCFFSLLGSKLL